MKKNKPLKKQFLFLLIKSFFWFLVGIGLGTFFLSSFAFLIFQRIYNNVAYPGVMVQGIDFSGKKESEIEDFFAKKNAKIEETKFIFTLDNDSVSISAKELDFGYDEDLISTQVYNLGRSTNTFTNITLVLQGYISGISLPASYRYSEEILEKNIEPLSKKVFVGPIDALFTFQNGRVLAFRPSSEGQEIDMEELKSKVNSKILNVILSEKPQVIKIDIPIRVLKPKITTDEVNTLGIKEIIGTGTSLFQGSIPNRIFNITLASTRLNGILVAPGETFSFNKALGDISAFTGYLQAYVIQNGRTVLGDGGGVCQVSTTLFRAILNAGLPVAERRAHAYRVGYYEQDSPPGFDATVYAPSPDLKFKNDTGNSILIQSFIDPTIQRLTFVLYGTKDGRTVTISKPTITNQSPAPAPLYQDDPTLPKGVIKQVDFAAPGATSTFQREVVKNGKVIISEKFVSNFQPWRAIFLKGTKE